MPNGIGSRLKTGPSQTGQLPGRIKSELCDLSGLRIDLISRLLSLSRLYSGILHSLSPSSAQPKKDGSPPFPRAHAPWFDSPGRICEAWVSGLMTDI